MSKINWSSKGGKIRLERIAAALSSRPMNVHELAKELGMTRKWAGENLASLHAARLIHIVDWLPWHTNTFKLPCYIWGEGEDMPRPFYDKVAKNRDTRAQRRADPEAHAAYLAKKREERNAKRAAIPPEERAAAYRAWRDAHPEAYKRRVAHGVAARSAKRAAKRAEKIEEKRAAEVAAKQEAYNRAMREAWRHARTIADAEERERYIAAQKLLNRPAQPDPLVGLFFGRYK